MPVTTVLLFCYRLPTISSADFRTYIEQTHVPLVQRLLGPEHPLTHTRYYINKADVSTAASGPHAGFVVGSPSAEDADLIAVITYKNPEAMTRSMNLRRSDGIRELIEADEARFMDRERIKVVLLGEEDVG